MILFSALDAHAENLRNRGLFSIWKEDRDREKKWIIRLDGLEADFSKHYLTEETCKHFENIAQALDLSSQIEGMFRGDPVNFTENRAALHTALRTPGSGKIIVGGQNVMEKISRQHLKMAKCVADIHEGRWIGFQNDRITDIVNIGIGGSDLGPRMVTEALKNFHHPGMRCHFVANADATELFDVLRQVNLPQTLFIVASKTFTTQETLDNAAIARQWFLDHTTARPEDLAKHFIAVTSNIDAAKTFGIDPSLCFEIGDFVGGRFSLWSAMGLPIALATNMTHFQALLRGAHSMDYHFQNAAVSENIPILMAFLTVLYQRSFNSHAQVLIPYHHRLERFVSYIQQLDMESLGKSVNRQGETLTSETGQMIWGGVGTNSQHTFHQLLYQGQHFISVEFITTQSSDHPFTHAHENLLKHCHTQAQALMKGQTEKEAFDRLLKSGLSHEAALKLAPFKAIRGGIPSTTLQIDMLAPFQLGQLIALYEHKVFTLSLLWNINAFDQFGVELGKQLWKQGSA